MNKDAKQIIAVCIGGRLETSVLTIWSSIPDLVKTNSIFSDIGMLTKWLFHLNSISVHNTNNLQIILSDLMTPCDNE